VCPHGEATCDFVFVHKVAGEIACNQNEMLKIATVCAMKKKSVLCEDNKRNQCCVTENHDKAGALMGDHLPQAGGIRRWEPRPAKDIEVVNVDTSSKDKAAAREEVTFSEDEDAKKETPEPKTPEPKTPVKATASPGAVALACFVWQDHVGWRNLRVTPRPSLRDCNFLAILAMQTRRSFVIGSPELSMELLARVCPKASVLSCHRGSSHFS
jgi:hypothetical protein